jgi:pimeloyl-ACP methyl ester carboxylesterase
MGISLTERLGHASVDPLLAGWGRLCIFRRFSILPEFFALRRLGDRVMEDRARFVRSLACCVAAVLVINVAGCARLMNFKSAERRDHGYTLVLTGIEGAHVGHAGLVSGLKSGGVPSEMEIVDWTTGMPPLMLVHLRYDGRNRRQAEQIAEKIVQYQDEYPGRPVNLIGHSGGGGMTLLTLEALPADRQVDSAILLAAAISPDYDLRPVLPKVERGIWNYSSLLGDGPLLIAGTTAFGTIDGKHTPAAGAVGFRLPQNASTFDRHMYSDKLFERPYRLRMALNGNLSDHYGPMNFLFARNELAPILRGAKYPDDTRSLDELMTTDPERQRPLKDPKLPSFRFSE